MKLKILTIGLALNAWVAGAENDPAYWQFAPTPPLGWNSWDAFGTTLNETQAKAQADAMAEILKPFGWQYFTVDIQWYQPTAQGHVYQAGAKLAMDEYSRLVPATEKFPSATNGAGFKPLADYVHAKGLKFGIHMMRGISRQAVRQNTPLLGTTVRAAAIANTNSTCAWNPDMYGVDLHQPGAQAYYDSLFQMYATWGLDFVKVDDISRPYDEGQKLEIEAIRQAIDKCGRPMVLSLSPGDTPLKRGEHVMHQANMWRISDDFWDRWEPLHGMFGRLDKWTQYRTPGAWPDADMLPFGLVEFGRPTHFTQDEQMLCMSLWSIAHSPLILGADLTRMDEFTRKLLTNSEVLAVNQASLASHQVSRANDLIVWAAEIPGSRDRYVGLFNAQSSGQPFDLSLAKYKSPTVRGNGGQKVDINVAIGTAHRLVLAVGDAGDGYNYDHAAWIEPTLTGPAGTQKLTALKWTSAVAGWGQVQVGKDVDGQPLTLNGQPVDGVGTHSVSFIEYELPAGYDTFTAKGMLTPVKGGKGSVNFFVLVDPERHDVPERSPVAVKFAEIGVGPVARVRDLWQHQELGTFTNQFSQSIVVHGAGLYRVSPVR